MRSRHRIPAALALVVVAVGIATIAQAASAQSLQALQPLDARGRLTYYIAEGEPDSGYRPRDPDLATWALGAWERSLDGAVRFEPAAEDQARLRVYWVPAEFGLYGEMRPLIVNGRRGAAVYIRPDMNALGPDIAARAKSDTLFRDTVVYLTCVHELGHALGLEHTEDFRDIMYFFGFGGDIPGFFGRYRAQLGNRGDIAKHSGLSNGDVARLRALYARR